MSRGVMGWLVVVAAAAGLLIGCSGQTVEQAPAGEPGATYSGPGYLHGTVGSLATLRGFEPVLVSGYGLAWGLEGTGSSEVPAFLRQWLINEMKKRGMGSVRLGTEEMSPERVLASADTAVVMIQGLIPAGATRGTRFDVLVSAVDTQTTSLDGGHLPTWDLALNGTDPSLRFSRPLASAGGALYINPFDDDGAREKKIALERSAVALSGGVVKSDQRIELILNQASWRRSRQIADRINERFPRSPSDRLDTAVAKTDLVIDINIPARFADRPGELLKLLSMLYIQRSMDFEPEQARRLGKVLESQPGEWERVKTAWVGLGKTALPVLRGYYEHGGDMGVRLAALEAGTELGDELCTGYLAGLAGDADAGVRRRVAAMLANLPSSLRGSRVLGKLVDDEDTVVRVAAYESLSRIHDPLIQRRVIGGREGFKFILDLVPAKRALVYITQSELPRLVIFNPNAGFRRPMVARLWDNHLMVRMGDGDDPATVFHQARGKTEGVTRQIAPTLANLALLLASKATSEDPVEGFDMTYSEVVHAVYALCRSGQVEAELQLQVNPLAEAIARAGRVEPKVRPETGVGEVGAGADVAGAGAGGDVGGGAGMMHLP